MAKSDITTSRKAAKAAGQKVYTGKPCPHGHDGTRYVSNRRCVGCAKPDELSPQFLAHQAKIAAMNAGEIFYHGQPCPKGHGTKRRVANRSCVVCEKIADDRFRENNPEACKEKRDRHYLNHLEKNRKRGRENSRRYRKENPDRYQSPIKEWRKKNQDKVRLYGRNHQHKRRAQIREGASTAELKEWLDGKKKTCYWCEAKCPDDYHVDHYFPLSKGGKHEIDNLVISCPTCNIKKNAKDPYEFAQERGRLF